MKDRDLITLGRSGVSDHELEMGEVINNHHTGRERRYGEVDRHYVDGEQHIALPWEDW